MDSDPETVVDSAVDSLDTVLDSDELSDDMNAVVDSSAVDSAEIVVVSPSTVVLSEGYSEVTGINPLG